MSDILTDLKARLARVPPRDDAGVLVYRHGPYAERVMVSVGELRALVERCEAAESQAQDYLRLIGIWQERFQTAEAAHLVAFDAVMAERNELDKRLVAERVASREVRNARAEAQVTIAGLEQERDKHRQRADAWRKIATRRETELTAMTAKRDSLFEQATALKRGIGTWAKLTDALVDLWLAERRKVDGAYRDGFSAGDRYQTSGVVALGREAALARWKEQDRANL